MEIHICKICGDSFETKYKHAIYCCDECREEASRRRDAARIRVGRRRKRKNNDISLSEIIKQAAFFGMSYGKFMSMRSMGKI